MPFEQVCMTGAERGVEDLTRRLDSPADLHEVRLDCLDRIDDRVFDVLRAHRDRIIATCRPVNEMGSFRGGEDDRLGILARAVEAGVARVDIELSAIEAGRARHILRHRAGTGAIVSHHAASLDVRALGDVVERMNRFPAGVAKIAAPVSGAADIMALARIGEGLSAFPARVVIGMGDAGVITRARPGLLRSAWTYVTASHARATAPGQLSTERAERFRVRDGLALAPYLLVGGLHVVHSPGPDVYNTLFARMGIPMQYLPVPARTWDEAMAMGAFAGAARLSVTMPFKSDAFRASEPGGADRSAMAARAANTIEIAGGRVVRVLNTDVEAAFAILSRNGARGRTVLILGTGGSAAAIGVAAAAVEAMPVFAARDPGAGRRRLAGTKAQDAPIVQWDERHEVPHAVLANCTPVGSDGADSPWDDDRPIGANLVMDLVIVKDRETALVSRARAGGVAVVTGVDFWCEQGAIQVSAATGGRFTHAMLRRAFDGIFRVRDGRK